MDNETKLLIALLIKNTVTLVCFAALAMFFGKWWISLFAILFLTNYKDDEKKGGADNDK